MILVLAAGTATAGKPELTEAIPPGVQRGQEQAIVLTGKRIGAPEQILWQGPGIDVLELTAEGDKQNRVKARLRVAADCPLGEHPFRLRTADGLSELRVLRVGPFPSVEEQEPNNEFDHPQAIPLNTTVSGVVTNEDVDHFAVEVKKGQRLNVEIEGIRIGQVLFDPYVALLDEKRFELASSDDTALLLQDATTGILAPADGRVVIQVRETSYGGSDRCRYRLHVGSFPRPTAAYPSGGPAGTTLPVQLIGDVAGDIEQTVSLPEAPGVLDLFAEQESLASPSGNPVRVTPFPNVLETEPNNARGEANPAEDALPLALNGRLGTRDDHDWFRFKAAKDQNLDIRVYARALRSPVDSVIDLYDEQGKRLAGNDDSGGPDSYLKWKAPADGVYLLRIRDHLGEGGAAFVYRVELTPVRPTLALDLPEFRRNTQDRMVVEVAQGNVGAILVRAKRENFGSPVQVDLGALPPGVTAVIPELPGAMDRVPVVFTAAPDAARAGVLLPAVGRSTDPKVAVEGAFRQAVDLVRANPNNTVYYRAQVDGLPLAVTEPLPYRLHIVPPKVPLVNGGSMALKVTAERDEGFDAPIKLRMLYTPPGIGAPPEITLAKGETSAFINLNADGKAETKTWPITVIGSTVLAGGERWAATPFADLQVAPPFVTGKIDMHAVERGHDVEVVCRLEQHQPFEGEAEVTLLGLPAKTKTEPQKVTASDDAVTFPVHTEADSPVGKHNSLFCSLVITREGEPIRHSIGGLGTLRIDPPPKKPAPKIAQVEKPAPAKPPAKKALSRLEQLRQQTAGAGG